MKSFLTARAATVALAVFLTMRQAAAQSLARPIAGQGAEAKTLLAYANTRPAYWLADGLESLKLRLHRVASRLETVAIPNAGPDRVAGAAYLVVYCPQLFPDLPKDFLQRIAQASQPVLWIGFGADKLAELVPFQGQFEVSAFAAGSPVTNVTYRGRDWGVTVDPWIPATIGTNSTSQVVMFSPDPANDRQTRRPICWKTAHATFFLAEPFVGSLGFLFEDLLIDFYQVKEAPPRRVFLRIEDYHCRRNHSQFRRAVDYLFARGHPFMVAVIPTYSDPSTGRSLDLDSQPEFVDALRYAQRRGGRLVLHGDADIDKNKPREADELWDLELDRPLAGETFESLRLRLQNGVRRMLRHGLLPLAWETPHYAASRAAYQEVAQVFSTAVERVQLSDATGLAHADIGGLTIDRYDRLIVPDNLGPVLDASVHFQSAIQARAGILTQLRGTVAGCFIQPYQPFEKLTALVESLERFQVPFLDLADLDNRVELPDALLLTGNAERRLTLRNSRIRWQAYDRDGNLLAQKQEPMPWSEERVFKRAGVGDCELFEIGQDNR